MEIPCWCPNLAPRVLSYLPYGSLLPALIERVGENPGNEVAGAHSDGHQYGGQKPTETFVTEFCYKGVNIFLEELINIKAILFRTHELFR